MRRCLALAVVLIAGCRCKGSQGVADAPPPPRPADVLCEAVAPDPSATWGRVHDLLGIVALTLPSSAFSLLTRAYHLPSGLEHKVEPRGPLVALLFDEGDALAWKLGDPERMTTLEKMELRPMVDGVRFAPRAHRPYGLATPFVVAGSSEQAIRSHLAYMTTGLARSTHSSDVRIEITSRGVRSEAVTHAAARFDDIKIAPTLPAPSTRPPARSETSAARGTGGSTRRRPCASTSRSPTTRSPFRRRALARPRPRWLSRARSCAGGCGRGRASSVRTESAGRAARSSRARAPSAHPRP